MERNRRRRVGEFRKGDIVRAPIGKDRIVHTCIILEDYNLNDGKIQCMAIFNFTGSPVGENLIDVTKHNLPWFDSKKSNTWVRINNDDCIWAKDVSKHYGNIKKLRPDVWDEICKEYYSCQISERLKFACDCEYDLIKRQVDAKRIVVPDCGCNQPILPVRLPV